MLDCPLPLSLFPRLPLSCIRRTGSTILTLASAAALRWSEVRGQRSEGRGDPGANPRGPRGVCGFSVAAADSVAETELGGRAPKRGGGRAGAANVSTLSRILGMKPLLAITMGDPTGIGPETIAKAWARQAVHDICRAVVLGHPEVMRRALTLVGAKARVVAVERPDQVEGSPEQLPCLACCTEDAASALPGRIDARGGEAAYQCVIQAARLAQAGRVDAMVTAPLSKAALAAAGHDYPGHTELLADLCSVSSVAMMLYLAPDAAAGHQRGLGVAHATLHVALHDVFNLLSTERILQTATLAHAITQVLLEADGVRQTPRIGVCALNPHGGEEGLFGDEERQLIRPAVERGRAAGLDVHGPFPADTLMSRAAAGEFDAVVAMYHDQGHIALKLLTMHHAVNVTLGLPVIRTSVAHGTAHDRAWQGTAQCESMIAAIQTAAKLVPCRRHLHWNQVPVSKEGSAGDVDDGT